MEVLALIAKMAAKSTEIQFDSSERKKLVIFGQHKPVEHI